LTAPSFKELTSAFGFIADNDTACQQKRHPCRPVPHSGIVLCDEALGVLAMPESTLGVGIVGSALSGAGPPPPSSRHIFAAVADLALRPGTGVWLSAKATETETYSDPATTTVMTPPETTMAADAECSRHSRRTFVML